MDPPEALYASGGSSRNMVLDIQTRICPSGALLRSGTALHGGMRFQGGKGLGTDDVLHAAGILRRNLRANTQMLQPLRQQSMPLIDSLRNDPSGLLQSNDTVLINFNSPLSRRFFIATLTLGLEKESSLAMSMERTCPCRFLQHQDRLQIVFRRFPNLYGLRLLSNSRLNFYYIIIFHLFCNGHFKFDAASPAMLS